MDCSTPGFPVHHQLPELAQTHVHRVGNAIQPCHPLSSPSPPTFSLSQHQGLFQWVSSSHQVAKVRVSASALVLPMNIQDWFPLGWTGWMSLQSKGLSRVFSNTTIQKHQFFGAQFSSVQLLSQVQLFATKPPYPSPPRIHPIPCPSSQWCHPTISSSVVPFSSCPQSFQTSGSFPMSQLFASGGQSTGVSASTSVLPMNTQLSLYSNSHIHTWLLEKLWLWLDGTLSANNVSAFEYAV